MNKNLKRISLMIREDQHDKIVDLGLNLSGLIRDLIDDFLSEHNITLAVTEETKQLYDTIISNTGSSDSEVEKYLKHTLKHLLKDKIEYMQTIQDRLEEDEK